MAKKHKSTWNTDLDNLFGDSTNDWGDLGIDVEEFFVPDVGPDAFIVEDEEGNAINEDENEHDCRYIRPRMKPLPRKQVIYEKAAALSRDIGLLKKYERVDTILSGKFVFGDFIEGYFVEHDLHTSRLLISTLSYNENNVDSLKNLLEGGYVDRIDMVVSDYFFAHERNKLVRYAYEQLDSEDNRFQLAVCRVHTKTYQFITDEGLNIVMHGSGNMRAGANFEQMTIEENEDLFKFYDTFYSEIIEEYPTIQKEKKYSKDWFKPDYNDKGKDK